MVEHLPNVHEVLVLIQSGGKGREEKGGEAREGEGRKMNS
jgi:hypothetical protein